MRIMLRSLAALTLLGAFAVPSAVAQDAPLGAFTSLVQEGPNGPWEQTITADAYTLENASDPAAVRYYWGVGDRDLIGSRTVTIEVEVAEGGETSGAGILYGFQKDTRYYYAFILDANGAVVLYRRDAAGFIRIMSSVTDAVRAGANTLSIAEDGDTMTMYLNGVETGSFSGDGVGAGGAGIVAVGTGRFVFTSYDDSSLN